MASSAAAAVVGEGGGVGLSPAVRAAAIDASYIRLVKKWGAAKAISAADIAAACSKLLREAEADSSDASRLAVRTALQSTASASGVGGWLGGGAFASASAAPPPKAVLATVQKTVHVPATAAVESAALQYFKLYLHHNCQAQSECNLSQVCLNLYYN
jgi:hypothetical protein